MASKEMLIDAAINCCNGKVGRRLLELAEKNKAIMQAVTPTGVEMIRQASAAGVGAAESLNCCNGKVGEIASVKEMIAEMSQGG